jgi:hypothetical protein
MFSVLLSATTYIEHDRRVGLACGVFRFTCAAQFALHDIHALLPFAELVYQASEFQQVHHAE